MKEQKIVVAVKSDNIFYSLYGMNVSMIIMMVEDLSMTLDDIRLCYRS